MATSLEAAPPSEAGVTGAGNADQRGLSSGPCARGSAPRIRGLAVARDRLFAVAGVAMILVLLGSPAASAVSKSDGPTAAVQVTDDPSPSRAHSSPQVVV